VTLLGTNTKKRHLGMLSVKNGNIWNIDSEWNNYYCIKAKFICCWNFVR